jgi:pteridine reductase
MELENRNALITGAAHRVGEAIALRLAKEGCNIAIHYHAAARESEQTLSEILSCSVEAHTYQADLRSHEEIKTLYESISHDFQRLDILINSAAIMQRIPFREVSPEDWETTIDLNLRAAFFCTQYAIRLMGDEGGAVINISDIAGLQPWVDFPVHSISKTGIEMLTKVAALAYAPSVRVNAVAPGPVLKPDHMSEARWAQLGTELPIGQAGEPADVAEAIIFLLKNDFITGETLVVDGGNQLI